MCPLWRSLRRFSRMKVAIPMRASRPKAPKVKSSGVSRKRAAVASTRGGRMFLGNLAKREGFRLQRLEFQVPVPGAPFSVRGRISIQFSLCQAVRRFCCTRTEGERLLPGKSLALVLTECDEGASKASGRMGLDGSLRRRNATTISGGTDDYAGAGFDDVLDTVAGDRCGKRFRRIRETF